MAETTGVAPRPLDGVRLLDLTDASAAFGTRLLADLGADVVRVEPPGGAELRQLAPYVDGVPDPERSLPHLYLDAGKRSVVVDRDSADGQAAFVRLLATADAVVETERLDPQWVRRHNPQIVQVTVTPFGLDGPHASWLGSDLIGVASGGLAWVCGSRDDPPAQPGGDQAHKLAGLAAAAAVAVGLTGRERRRGGVHIDLSVQECVALSTLHTANPAAHRWHGEVARRPGLTAVHRCADGGFVTLHVPPPRLEAFCAWVAEEGIELPADHRALLVGRDAVMTMHRTSRALCERYPREELLKRAWELDLMGLPVNTLRDLAVNEHMVATEEFVPVVDDARGLTLSVPRSPAEGLAAAAPRRAPLLGEHTSEVLSSLPPAAAAVVATGDPAPELARALEGIRVLDFCWVIAGPLGTRLLADFGADVIRVESDGRALAEIFPPGVTDRTLGAFHNVLNAQKRSLTVDPRSARGRELLLDLVAHVDVVTSNYRPGALEAMGFGYDVLRAVNPRVVNVQVPGCGRRGPWAQRTSFGNMVSAAAGISALTGFPGRAPRGMGTAYPDFTTPALMATMILAALRQRDRTGVGCEVEVNQLAATVALIGVEWMQYAATGTEPPPRANRDPNHCPHGTYPAAGDDQWVAVAVRSDGQFAALCGLLGRAELTRDPRFGTHLARKQHEDELDGIVAAWTRRHGKWAAAEQLQAAGVPAAPVEDIRDTLDCDPQLTRHYQRVRQPSAPDIEIPINGEPIQVAGARRELRPAPQFGGDTTDILRDLLGLGAPEIEQLRREGVLH